ncbi:hypothetical protein H2198_006266 [Neophaeococcomyces mojaviensis]|uniref:Uncharacterized protein n=1 Tax=Neophaeococcomyces mojaviensis TaxID=3383035 RepID=A0ACC3A3D3_9EURO|nr:hypothetical protein H2198_006266 [Knufia sp. JES_112]
MTFRNVARSVGSPVFHQLTRRASSTWLQRLHVNRSELSPTIPEDDTAMDTATPPSTPLTLPTPSTPPMPVTPTTPAILPTDLTSPEPSELALNTSSTSTVGPAPYAAMGPIAECLIEVLQMISDLISVDDSYAALQREMIAMAVETKQLSDSFSTHFVMHPITAPCDGAEHPNYYVQLFVGKYICSLIDEILRSGKDIPEISYDSIHITQFLNRLYRNQSREMNYVQPPQAFYKWQGMLRWWRKLYGPLVEETGKFFYTLRTQGLVHLPQNCICNEGFVTLYRRIVRLCLLIQIAKLQYSFGSISGTKLMRNLTTGDFSDHAQDCVIPALRIRRNGEDGWETVCEGYGVWATNNHSQEELVIKWM